MLITISRGPPLSCCELRTSRLKRRISPKFQKGLLEPSEPRRLAQRPISVSEPPSSLTERTSPVLVRHREVPRFQAVSGVAQSNLLRLFFRLASSPGEREVGVF